MGVGRDISFDTDLIRLYGLRVVAFDPTSLAIDWLKPRLSNLPKQFDFRPWGLAHYDGEATFSLQPAHCVSYSIKYSAPGVETDTCRVYSRYEANGLVYRDTSLLRF